MDDDIDWRQMVKEEPEVEEDEEEAPVVRTKLTVPSSTSVTAYFFIY